MELSNYLSTVFSGIVTGVTLLLVSQRIDTIQENKRCRSLMAFLRLEIMNNYRLINEWTPASKHLPKLEDNVWEKVNTEIINKLPFVLTNHLIVHYYFIRNSADLLPASLPKELERQKNRMKFLIKRLQKFSKEAAQNIAGN